VKRHERVFLVEQNRDGQLRTLLMNEGNLDPARIVPVLHYDGTPITARFIHAAIAERVAGARILPMTRAGAAE
jgi:2-oxoglutarate ferredoxin oxidoreductase subunit alpha